MCGICGLVFTDQRPVDPEVIGAMTRTLVHRGPDDEGIHVKPGVGLGHRRLSIIDIAGGHQPMYNETGDVCVVCNGEIYNFQALRQDLEARGHVFRTRSDTEVLVHLYEERGPDMVEALSGMFAIAIWDARTRTLLLARDPMGQKPLYYAERPGGLLFASEMKAILASGLIDKKVDPDGLRDYFALTYTLAPLTTVQGIRQAPPGHLLIWRNGSVTTKDYRDVPEPTVTQSREACEEELTSLLQEAVSCRLVSEAPLGVFLSGGIDSSSIVAAMAHLGVGPIKTFGIGFREKSYDERPYIRMISERFGTEHHELVLEPDLPDDLPDLVHVLDAPFADASSIPMYYLARFARTEVKVVLGGDGGDELFGGYPTLQADLLAERYRRLPIWLRRNGGGGRIQTSGFSEQGQLRSQGTAIYGRRRASDAGMALLVATRNDG